MLLRAWATPLRPSVQARRIETNQIDSTRSTLLAPSYIHPKAMITDVQLAALSNWLGSIGVVLIVVYHVSSPTCGGFEGNKC